jgi:hypothetical protein
MSEELTTQTKDSTAEMAEYIGQAIDETFAALIESRDSQYAAAIAPLDAERESLSQEHTAIGEAAQNLAELLPARARVAQAEHDRLLLAGDRAGAGVKLAEQKEAEHAAEAMRARQREISNRIEAIGEIKREQARRIFADWYLDCQKVIRPIEHGFFVVLLDGLQKSFFDFQNVTDTGGDGVLNTLFKLGHITNLTAHEHSQEWTAGRKWYGGRR